MTIYFDGVHLATDGDIEELHFFANILLGMSKSWFQDHPLHPHYDVWGKRVGRAIKRGAVRVNSKELVLKCYAKQLAKLRADYKQRLESSDALD